MRKKPTVLFVMGDQRLRSILVRRFTLGEWKADGVDDLEEGERKAVRFRPSVFAFEPPKGEKKLSQIIKHLRSLPTLHAAKLIVLLKHPPREVVDEAHHAGADGVMLWGSLSPQDVIKAFAKYV